MRKLDKHLLLLLALLAGPILSFGQDFLPTLNDNYMGINQALLQPAAIADSRFKSDWNVAGFSNDIYNDAIRFRSRWILYPTQIITNDDWWDETTYIAPANGKDKNMFMSQSVLGPGFMVNLDSNSRFTIGFTSRVRSLTNIDGMDEPLFRLMYSNYTEEKYYNKWYFDEKMRAMQHIFGDYGITYAQVIPITKNKDHFLKAGITLKLLQGIASSYLQTNELYYYFNGEAYPEAKPISWNSPYAEAGISDNWGDIDEYGNYTFSMNYQLTAKPSVGFDLGVVYEFRKDMIRTRDTLNQKVPKVKDRLTRPDLNKYFLKVGISLLDIGSLTYEKDYYSSDLNTYFTTDYLERYNNGDNSVPEGTYWLDGNDLKFNYQNYVPFSQEMHQRSLNGQGVNNDAHNKEKFYVKLPAAISLQADLNLFLEGLYVNVTTYWGIKTGYSHAPNSHYISNYNITPRYEKKWYGVSLPVEINSYGKLSVGLGVRAGVFYFGVNNLFSNAFSDPYGISAYAGVKIPIHQKDPTKLPIVDEKKSNQTIVCCPCCDCRKIICRDTNFINNIDCLPGSVQITASHSTININSNNGNGSSITPPAERAETKPVENQSPESTKSTETGITSTLVAPDDSEVYFDFNSFKIRPVDLTAIDAFIEYLLSDSSKKARLTGYTDSIDTDDYNITLSKNRTQSVYNYMIQHGVKPEQLIKEWKGETNPKGDNTTTEGRQKNRRVEIELLE